MKFEGSIEFSIVEHTEDRVVSKMPIHKLKGEEKG